MQWWVGITGSGKWLMPLCRWVFTKYFLITTANFLLKNAIRWDAFKICLLKAVAAPWFKDPALFSFHFHLFISAQFPYNILFYRKRPRLKIFLNLWWRYLSWCDSRELDGSNVRLVCLCSPSISYIIINKKSKKFGRPFRLFQKGHV